MTRGTIKAWYLVHKWTSLICTAFLLMLCVTGLPLIFHEEIDGWLDPPAPLAALPATTPALSLDTILARAAAQAPGDIPLYLSFDDHRPIVYVTTGPTPDAVPAAMHFLALDARTGTMLPPHVDGVMDFILKLHTDMLLGFWAEIFLGFMGLLFFAAIVSGVVLYAPFMAKLDFGTLRRNRSTRLGWLDRHNLLGIVTLVWASVVGLTGTFNTLVVPITGIWKANGLAAIMASEARTPLGTQRASVQAALDAVQRKAPDMTPQFIAFPGVVFSSKHHYAVFLRGTTPLTSKLLLPGFVDAATGRLDAVTPMPWYMQAMLLAQPLHFGDYGGMAMKIVWAVFDALTIVVLGSGLYLWLRRRGGPSEQRVREVVMAGEA
ncbi:putative iron-regulated membrane protein [Sphingomonas sp. PP-F2F-G114-C0414]|uniref:PepSY-associated TM helix domain-containing protein n=1 Tax=Sphingomonas sp. PP-F2F-G114-C0414 TaxID=2135662 RepID=UPI000EF93E98|nr:PepSY domain-containing protein [Sphingomonas sp. PP-F2F-G114-C0414]RMB28539.1 putative iron-regulated membrane protein [Sphingomonas sp. PP-F2F-G114-C0414]